MRLLPILALPLLLATLVSCSGGSSGGTIDPGGPPAHNVSIVQDAEDAGPNAFSPANPVISLSSQNTITWFNADVDGSYGGGSGTEHHLKSDDGTTFESGDIQPEGVFEATFSAPGTYAYHCEIHREMTGTITVLP